MKILDSVLSEFEKISVIPRPSKYESKVAKYLVERLNELGVKAEIDEVGNVIGEVAASKDFENKPVVILQAHMDMVCVSDSSKNFDPLTDGIEIIREGEYLKAKGTSLGADDGIGIAIILHILANHSKHSRLRVIFTVDEETGMSGARGLNKKCLDADYLINIDSENVDELVVGSAGSMRIELKQTIDFVKPAMKNAFEVKISGLKGGHSGEAIGINHANAIKVLGEILSKLDCEIASVEGGRAMNVIPSEASAYMLVDTQNFNEISEKFLSTIRKQYDETNAQIEFKSVDKTEQVFSRSNFESFLKVISELEDGLHDSETSANIGVLKVEDSTVKIEYMPRFHSDHGREFMSEVAKSAAKVSNYEINFGETSPAWKSEKFDLAEKMIEIASQQGRQIKQRVIHGGLECSYFSAKNPNLEIVSIGTTNLDIHSPKERLLLSSVEPTVNLVMETLNFIAGVENE
ncbi:MAG: beta-Ala-His dipeptidase [Selenomonadaceae bacterium]|nr:beta-Ala-His dipeptidase [Selenomonadaceae bacterium]